MADFPGQVLPVSLPSAVPTSTAASDFTPTGGGSVAAIYAQRVFSSGLADWCYFVGIPDSTPASGDTTPNWTGAITAYEVVSGRLN